MTRHWHDGLKVGIPQVDDDHRHLFGILSDLERLSAANGATDPARVEAALRDLAAYAREHFEREEAIQAEVGFEGLEENHRQHVELTLTLEAFIAKYRTGGLGDDATAATRIREFLVIWVEEHILKTDLRMRGRILPWAG